MSPDRMLTINPKMVSTLGFTLILLAMGSMNFLTLGRSLFSIPLVIGGARYILLIQISEIFQIHFLENLLKIQKKLYESFGSINVSKFISIFYKLKIIQIKDKIKMMR